MRRLKRHIDTISILTVKQIVPEISSFWAFALSPAGKPAAMQKRGQSCIMTYFHSCIRTSLNASRPTLRFPESYVTLRRMSEPALKVLAVVGSLHRGSLTRSVIQYAAKQFQNGGCVVDILDFDQEPLALYNPDTAHEGPAYAALRARVEKADVILLGTPDYHGGISGTAKNFLDHFWREFAGKLFATIVASHEKGLTATDQLRTVARQCYAWSLPYGVSFTEDHDFKDGQIVNDAFKQRLEMLVRDTRVYGQLLTRQRRADLSGTEPGFLARHRE